MVQPLNYPIVSHIIVHVNNIFTTKQQRTSDTHRVGLCLPTESLSLPPLGGERRKSCVQKESLHIFFLSFSPLPSFCLPILHHYDPMVAAATGRCCSSKTILLDCYLSSLLPSHDGSDDWTSAMARRGVRWGETVWL